MRVQKNESTEQLSSNESALHVKKKEPLLRPFVVLKKKKKKRRKILNFAVNWF